jgi:hypothetical protein
MTKYFLKRRSVRIAIVYSPAMQHFSCNAHTTPCDNFPFLLSSRADYDPVGMSEARGRVLRLVEAASDPKMKLYLMRLALSWMQSAAVADEQMLEEA